MTDANTDRSAERTPLAIDTSDLIGTLKDIETQSDGDLARLIELLLLENHVLSLGQSTGFRRGVNFDFSAFPRFLQIVDRKQPETQER